MRWKYLIPRLVIVGLAWTFFAFGFDPLVRMGMITAGESATEARVNIAGVQTELFPPAVSINNVQIANRNKPGTNLLQFDQFRFHMRGDALLYKRYIIEEGTMIGLRFGSDREDSGLLDNVPLEQTDDSDNGFGQFADKAKELGEDWLAGVIQRTKMQGDLSQFESIQLAKLKEQQWKDRLADYQQRVKNLELKVKQIEESTKKPKGNFLEKMENYRHATVEVKQVLDESNKIRTEFPQLSKIAQRDFVELDEAKKRDQEKIKQKINVFNMDGKELTNILLGPELATRLQQATSWFSWGQQKYAGMKQTEPERQRGIDIFFPPKDNLPLMLIKKLHLSGEMQLGNELLPFRGEMTGITTDPQLYGKPTVIDIDAQGKSHFRLHSETDYHPNRPVHRLQMVYVISEMKETELGSKKSMGLAVSAGRTEWVADLTLSGEQLSGTVKLVQSPVAVIAKTDSELSPHVSETMEQAVSGIKKIEATVELAGTLQKPKWKLKSNLGDQISNGISTAMTAQLEHQKQKLAQKLDAEYLKQTTALNQMMAKEFKEITAGLQLNDQFAQQQIKKLTGSNPNLREAKRQLDFKKLFR